MDDPFRLQRFVDAQDRVYDRVTAELAAGRKRSHWMWFIFPQLDGLGFSATARRYAISGRAEAHAYLAHPLLGPRLRECTGLMLRHTDRPVDRILVYPDNLKFRSSMTLFAQADVDETVFAAALDRFFDGVPDDRTLDLLG